jgi:O-antigen/teichoic acid export membrane protein
VFALAKAAMSAATWIFFVGIAGSLLVILISFFEDLHELLGKE